MTNSNLTRKRWAILALSCLINLCAGSIYAWSVFAAPLAERLSASTGEMVTAGTLAMAFSIANSVGPVPMIIGGWVNDRFGPRFVIASGGIMMGLGLVGCALAQSVMHVLIAYGIFFGVGLGLTYGCTVSNSIKFFPDRRGLIGGLTTAFYGSSSVIVPPIAAVLIESYGVDAAFLTFGIIFGTVIFVGGLLSMKCPDGFIPDGYVPPAGRKGGVDKNWREMLASRTFYPMIVLLMSGAVPGMMLISQASNIAQNMAGITAATAAGLVSVMALANTLGRIIAGTVSDRLGRVPTLMMGLVACIIGAAVLGFSSDTFGVACAFVIVGLSFGTFMSVFPGFNADEFGSRHNTVNYAIMFIGFAVAGMVGPTTMARMFAATGSYVPGLMVTASICAVGLVAGMIYLRMKKTAK